MSGGLWEPVSGVFWSTAPLLPSLEWIGNLGNSSFFTTVFGALAGAFAGAWVAQRIAERSKLREEWQKEIRNTNTGIVLASTTCNLAYALKKQHIKPIKDSYDADCKEKDAYVRRVAAGVPQAPLSVTPNLLSLHEISPPVDTLQEIVLGRLSTTGRALAATTAVADAIRNLNNAIAKRNGLIERIKDEKLPEGAEVQHFYFGTPYAEGKANQEYGSYVKALALYTDDAIFFSIKLYEDLREHGLDIAGKYKKKFGGEAPGISHIDWKKADQEGLLPKDEDYKSWLSGYQTAPKKKRSWWQRKDRSSKATG
jgi:hypothetical protein